MARDDPRDVYLDVPSEGFAGRIEVMPDGSGRRRWPDEVKARIVAESYQPDMRVADVARLHGTTRWQIYHWRKLAKKGVLALPAPPSGSSSFATVVVEETPPVEEPTTATVEIVLGDMVIRAPAGADEAHLARAIRAARAST